MHATAATMLPISGRILRLPEVCNQTGLGRSMIYQLEAESRFPGRIKIGARAVGWLEPEVRNWIADQVHRTRGTGPAADVSAQADVFRPDHAQAAVPERCRPSR